MVRTPSVPRPDIEENFSGLNLYDAEQQTGLQLNYGNYFKIAGEDGGAVFRVGGRGNASETLPFVMFSEQSGLIISSSDFKLQEGGGSSVLEVNKVIATDGTIGKFDCLNKITSDDTLANLVLGT